MDNIKKAVAGIGWVVLAVAVLLGFFIGRASAWDFQVSGVGVCNERTGEYDLTWTIDNPENETATIAESSSASVSGTIAAQDSEDYTESVAGSSTGESLEVRLEWPSDKNQPPKIADIALKGDCEAPEEPPKEEEPQVKEVPKGGVATGSGGYIGK